MNSYATRLCGDVGGDYKEEELLNYLDGDMAGGSALSDGAGPGEEEITVAAAAGVAGDSGKVNK